MEKNNLTPEESFAIINKAISNFKMNYKESGKSFLLWGWMLTFASFSHFVILRILYSKEAYELVGLFSLGIWIISGLVAFTIQLFMDRKMNREKKVYSYLDIYLKKIGYITAISFSVAIFICIKQEILPPPVMLLVGGIITSVAGVLLKFKPLIIGGMAFFLFSIASTFVSNEYIALVAGTAIICGYLIPGYFLKAAKE
ncbi:MAG: hypothetical protein R6W81_01555 [Bacteroidales bacterium]